MITPDGRTGPGPRIDSALVKGDRPEHTAGSACWKRGVRQHHRVRRGEKIDRSCLCRVLRLTLRAPEIVEATLDGRQPEEVTLPGPMKGFPVEWERPRA